MEKVKCPHCKKVYSKMGISTHIWRSHGEGKSHDPNKNRVAWNKGLTKETDERVKKFSDTLSGRESKLKNKTFEEIYGEKKAKKLKSDITKRQLKKYKNIEERKKLRDFGRKGGFGKKGITKGGTRYESLLEKEVFEYLEHNNINFEAHKYIPNSSKVSDVYLIDKDLWIEIDGIDREKKKEWLGSIYNYWIEKLEIYKREKLDYKIVYSLEDIANIV